MLSANFYFASLGCSKNLVDSQVMLGLLGQEDFKITQDAAAASVIIINTCSFIEAAKAESIEMILDLANYKDSSHGCCQILVVAGCLPQRYVNDLEKELPEVDLFIGTGEYQKITKLLKEIQEGRLTRKTFVDTPTFIPSTADPRVNTSPFYTAWLKIAEGCDRHCTFCIIPTIRGTHRSRSIDSLVEEACQLQLSGVRELNLISQDLSSYGQDLDKKNDLYHLLMKLEEQCSVDWIRLFYYYPDDLDDKVIKLMASSKKICPYLDTPIQHFSDNILKKMNRHITSAEIDAKIDKLRHSIPNIYLRTSVIVGFPGESEKDFKLLLNGIDKNRFNHLGVFRYSDEEGTPAFSLPNKVPTEVIEERFQEVYLRQKKIVSELNQKHIGKTFDVLIEGKHQETDLLLRGRHQGQAPEIDGQVIINRGYAKEGEIKKVKISDTYEYDLLGELEEQGRTLNE